MFKGFNKKFQEGLEKNNQDSDVFTFSFMNLELVEVNGNRRKCRIIDEELSKELYKLVSPRSPKPTFIEFKTYKSFYFKDNDIIWPNLSGYLECIKRWIKVHKVENIGQHPYLKNTKVSQDGVLSIEYFEMSTCVKDTARFYGNIYDNEWNYNNPLISEIHPGYDKKIREAYSTRTSALTQINNTLKKGNIDFTTLRETTMFLGTEDSYLQAWPNDCLHCPGEYEKDPFNAAVYHQTHINKCLWRSDRINEFKDNQIELIKRIINKFNDYKKEVIEEVIEEAQEQGITENELNNTRPGWQDFLRKLTNREQISEYFTNQLEVDIKNLVEAKKKSGEEKIQAEKEAKEKAKKAQDRLKKAQEEKEKQQKKQEEEKIKREQEQAQKEQEKLKKQERERIKEEEKRWFWEQLAEEAKKKEQEKATQEEKIKLEKQQQELEQREKELEKQAEEAEQNNNPNSIILKKFANIPNFNSKEKIEKLIEPVKNNPNFLQQLKANNIPNLTALIVNKSPQEIIITVKRFEYDKDKDKDKDKRIRAYYYLKPNENLTDDQISEYLYREAIGQITSSTENPNNKNNGLLIPLILAGGLLILFSITIIRIKLKKK